MGRPIIGPALIPSSNVCPAKFPPPLQGGTVTCLAVPGVTLCSPPAIFRCPFRAETAPELQCRSLLHQAAVTHRPDLVRGGQHLGVMRHDDERAAAPVRGE